MKFNRTFIVVIIVLMAVMLLFETNAPSRFQWNDYSQSYRSKQPFGCYVMDSVLRASLPQGYEVLGSDIDSCFDDKHKREKHTFLFTNNYDDFFDLFEGDFLELIKEGNNVIFATDYYYSNDSIDQQIGFSLQRIYRSSLSKEALSDSTSCDTINWHSDDKFAPATYLINSVFCQDELVLSGPFRTLATLNEFGTSYYNDVYDVYNESTTITVAGIRNYGKGKVIVVCMPLIFTNYGILNDDIRPFALRVLSECGDLPVVRYDQTLMSHDAGDNMDSESPLRYLLSNRPLRWAFYLALATLVAFVLFSARRRQRVIPVIHSPVNHMMDFVKRIGGIYYQRHDNVDLLIKKYASFSSDVRTQAMIDIDDYDHIEDELQSLSNRTGIPFKELQKQIYDVWNATNADSISDERLRQLIDVMNNIRHKINI